MSDDINDYERVKVPNNKCSECAFVARVPLCIDASCVVSSCAEDDMFYIFKLKDKSKGESDD